MMNVLASRAGGLEFQTQRHLEQEQC